MINIQEKKEKILNFIKENGPSLPVRLSKAIEMDPVFVSAIASELLANGQVKTSNLKVGASYLYLIPGQEVELEKFKDNLKKPEKEAADLLKEKTILIDEECSPTTRVALRNIKDFAVPLKINDKIIWKYAFVEDSVVQEILSTPKEDETIKDETEIISEEDIEEELDAIKEVQEENTEIFEEELTEPEEIEEEIPKGWIAKKEEIKKAREESQNKLENIFQKEEEIQEPEFFKDVKKFLSENKIEFLEEIRTEKKEIMGKVKIDSQLGEIKMLLIAKDKKTTNKDEIRSSIQMATNAGMPCLLIIRKEPSKAIQNLLDENSLIKLKVMD